MTDMIQTIQFIEPSLIKMPMPHFSDKILGAHTLGIYDNKTVNISYVAPDLTTITNIIQLITSYSNTFLPISATEFVDIPIECSVNLAVDQPIGWSVTYQYPRTINDYINTVTDDFGKIVSPIEFSSDFIFSYSLSLTLQNVRFCENGILVGLKFLPATYNMRMSLFQESDDPDLLLPKYFILNLNPNDIVSSVTKTETVDGVPIWDYTWSGSLM